MQQSEKERKGKAVVTVRSGFFFLHCLLNPRLPTASRARRLPVGDGLGSGRTAARANR